MPGRPSCWRRICSSGPRIYASHLSGLGWRGFGCRSCSSNEANFAKPEPAKCDPITSCISIGLRKVRLIRVPYFKGPHRFVIRNLLRELLSQPCACLRKTPRRHALHHRLHRLEYIFLARQSDISTCQVGRTQPGRAVSTRVFIAEARRDLKIA